MLFWKEQQHFDQLSRTDWPPLDKILPQDMTAATEQIERVWDNTAASLGPALKLSLVGRG